MRRCFQIFSLPSSLYSRSLKELPHLVNLKNNVVDHVASSTKIAAVSASFNCLFNRYYCSNAANVSVENDNVEETKIESESKPIIDVETSKRYLKSKSYQTTYNNALVWQPYRRNHRGHLPPSKIRKSCCAKGKLLTGNPCPICRDEYLVLHHENVDLLKQFVSPYTGEVLSNHVTNLCQVQQKKLLICIEQAWDLGNLEKSVPFREYKYEDYYPELKKGAEENQS